MSKNKENEFYLKNVDKNSPNPVSWPVFGLEDRDYDDEILELYDEE